MAAQGASVFFIHLQFCNFIQQLHCRHRHRRGSSCFTASELSLEMRFRFCSSPSIYFKPEPRSILNTCLLLLQGVKRYITYVIAPTNLFNFSHRQTQTLNTNIVAAISLVCCVRHSSSHHLPRFSTQLAPSYPYSASRPVSPRLELPMPSPPPYAPIYGAVSPAITAGARTQVPRRGTGRAGSGKITLLTRCIQ